MRLAGASAVTKTESKNLATSVSYCSTGTEFHAVRLVGPEQIEQLVLSHQPLAQLDMRQFLHAHMRFRGHARCRSHVRFRGPFLFRRQCRGKAGRAGPALHVGSFSIRCVRRAGTDRYRKANNHVGEVGIRRGRTCLSPGEMCQQRYRKYEAVEGTIHRADLQKPSILAGRSCRCLYRVSIHLVAAGASHSNVSKQH